MVLANTIRHLRFGDGETVLSQQELADQVGVSRQTINAIERGKHQPSLELAFRIAGVFDKPIDDVFLFFPDVEIDYESLEAVVIQVCWEKPGP